MGTRLINRLYELSSISDGWLDGRGLAPTKEALELASPLAVSFNDDIKLFPTETGGLQFEGNDFEILISGCGLSSIQV
jgi:hypothetical protein